MCVYVCRIQGKSETTFCKGSGCFDIFSTLFWPQAQEGWDLNSLAALTYVPQ